MPMNRRGGEEQGYGKQNAWLVPFFWHKIPYLAIFRMFLLVVLLYSIRHLSNLSLSLSILVRSFGQAPISRPCLESRQGSSGQGRLGRGGRRGDG